MPLCFPVCLCVKLPQSCPTLWDPWTLAHQTPLSMGFSRQEYWSGLLCPLAGDLPNPGTEPKCLLSPALAGRFSTTGPTWEALTSQQRTQNTSFPVIKKLRVF